jgi:hypothetical protein
MLNPFNQSGAELGKVLANRNVAEFESPSEPALGQDSSTNALIRWYRTATTHDGSRSREDPRSLSCTLKCFPTKPPSPLRRPD